ncbi:hypothetical protein [Streptomyces xantholiticus]|nr:hypothetical protein [Streptomyces xantholiticus]
MAETWREEHHVCRSLRRGRDVTAVREVVPRHADDRVSGQAAHD